MLFFFFWLWWEREAGLLMEAGVFVSQLSSSLIWAQLPSATSCGLKCTMIQKIKKSPQRREMAQELVLNGPETFGLSWVYKG